MATEVNTIYNKVVLEENVLNDDIYIVKHGEFRAIKTVKTVSSKRNEKVFLSGVISTRSVRAVYSDRMKMLTGSDKLKQGRTIEQENQVFEFGVGQIFGEERHL